MQTQAPFGLSALFVAFVFTSHGKKESKWLREVNDISIKLSQQFRYREGRDSDTFWNGWRTW